MWICHWSGNIGQERIPRVFNIHRHSRIKKIKLFCKSQKNIYLVESEMEIVKQVREKNTIAKAKLTIFLEQFKSPKKLKIANNFWKNLTI